MTVPLHPEAVPGDAAALRWIVPADLLPFAGAATTPGELGLLLSQGVLASVVLEPGSILTRLGSDAGDGVRSAAGGLSLAAGGSAGWSAYGARVRTALHAAVAAGEWTPLGTRDDVDAVLATQVASVLAGSAGETVRAHGGAVSVASVRNGHVELLLEGSCRGCPAAFITIGARLEQAIKRECPGVVAVTHQ